MAYIDLFEELTRLSKDDRLAFIALLAKRYPYEYLVAPMGPTERKFYDGKLKR